MWWWEGLDQELGKLNVLLAGCCNVVVGRLGSRVGEAKCLASGLL